MTAPQCRLYLITPPVLPDLDAFCEALEAALGGGDVACLQLRLKDAAGAPAPDVEVLAAAARIAPVLKTRDIPLLVNDRPDLAKAAGADGVHIGQQDGTVAEARALLGDEAVIGVTCHNSRHLAMEAGEAGADYVAFGAFFPTDTKQVPTEASPDLLQWWAELFEIPCVAIGGVTAENCAPLVTAGADFLAVSAGVWRYPDGPAAGVAALNAAITAAAD